MSFKPYSLILFISSALFFFACEPKSKEGGSNQAPTFEAQEQHDILLEDLDGNAINLEDFKGKVVFLNFWATWCKPCIAEMPSIDKLKMELENDEYVFIAASDENIEKIKKFASRYPHEFQYAHLKTNVYKLGLSVLPTTYIINKEGEIVEKVVGAKEWNSEENVQQLKEI